MRLQRYMVSRAIAKSRRRGSGCYHVSRVCALHRVHLISLNLIFWEGSFHTKKLVNHVLLIFALLAGTMGN